MNTVREPKKRRFYVGLATASERGGVRCKSSDRFFLSPDPYPLELWKTHNCLKWYQHDPHDPRCSTSFWRDVEHAKRPRKLKLSQVDPHDPHEIHKTCCAGYCSLVCVQYIHFSRRSNQSEKLLIFWSLTKSVWDAILQAIDLKTRSPYPTKTGFVKYTKQVL